MGKEGIREFNKKICGGALFFGVLVSVLSLVLGRPSISKGFLLGTCFSIINFILMGLFQPFSWRNDRKRATAVYFASILVRYSILAIPIIAAVKLNKFDLIATVAGIFSIQIVIFTFYVIKPMWEKRLSVPGD